MNQEISPLLKIEKKIENENSSINDDYEMIKAIYPDDIKEINNNSKELYFLLKLKYEIEIKNSTNELIHSLKLDDLLDCNNSNYIYLPYWLKILYSKEKKILNIFCYVFWFKYEENIKKKLEEQLNENIDEPILYNIIELTKDNIENSLKDKNMVIDVLNEIRELMIMKVDMTTDNFLLYETGVNDDLEEDFKYEEKKLKHTLNKNEKNQNKDDRIQKERKKLIEKEESKKENENYNYEKFFEDGGFVGETIIDRASTFQAHAIKIKNKKEFDFYKKCLLTQKKIKKATHNITIYRYFDKENNQIVEDYDDDGEDGAGFRVLGMIKKMKLNNLFVMVTRWYGGTLLHQDRFKRINDAAQILLNNHCDVFEPQDN